MKSIICAQGAQGAASKRLLCAVSSLLALSLVLRPDLGQASKGAAVEDSSLRPSVTSAAPALALNPAALQAEVARIQYEVSAERGIPADAPIRVEVASADQLRNRMFQLILEEVGAEKVAISQRVNETLGLLPRGTSYLEIMLSTLQRQVAGYYDYRVRTFYLMDTDAANFSSEIIEHELIHALQDLRWPMGAMIRPEWSASDLTTSRSMLIEGDATLFMLRQVLEGLPPGSQIPALRTFSRVMENNFYETEPDLPRFMAHSMIAPYAHGLAFAGTLYFGQDAGWDGVNRAFDDLPLSTEQVLYPERWQAETRDEPTFLTNALDTERLGERKLVDIIGMAGIRGTYNDLLDGVLSSARVEMATEAWDGDRFEYWEDELYFTLVWTLVFDSVEGANAFYALSETLVPTWLRGGELKGAEGAHGARVGGATKERAVVLERWGDAVVLVIREAFEHGNEEALRLDSLATASRALQTHQRFQYPQTFRTPKGRDTASPR